ncbi:starch-binding domain protein (macronuclear) [Tetrahymena thermophila SB210]|uniref:Starch-binding domain protein n=1 Tax=Tetrahymena thermophila (strain SB210) TaxID=312017 RepID=I7MMF8_TETTS|nr:starch-binding domain protein [Tetrahymena thermophila SB210]EAS04774.2 starch-binding domain protein [Tetrahymena thermophila SB210]|eukprot:XP_001025019.2 starch-binding domain protein [Tetrahymena thermophila SB210]
MNHQKLETEVRFTVSCTAYFGQAVYISGSCEELGNWNPELAIRMNWSEGNLWWCVVSLSTNIDFVYKYYVSSYENMTSDVCWEQISNRVFSFQESQTKQNHDVFDHNFIQSQSQNKNHIETEGCEQTLCLGNIYEITDQQLSCKQESSDRLEVQKNCQERSSIKSSSICNSEKSFYSPKNTELSLIVNFKRYPTYNPQKINVENDKMNKIKLSSFNSQLVSQNQSQKK